MNLTLAEKIISSHLRSGQFKVGQEISIQIDQTLTQDATGTLAYLQLEALHIDEIKTKVAVSYIDHNTMQTGFENADDHLFLQSIAAKYGLSFSRAGNGICHQVHLERFVVPGQTLLGSDSHTPTAGAVGMLAIGAGGLNVALALVGEPYSLTMPQIVNIRLAGALPPLVTAKDIVLEVLRRLTVKGGVGKILEYSGPGVKTLTVPERATITNMGAETGCTTSIFPSDERTREYFKEQGRINDWVPLAADEDANYETTITINLSDLEPLIAKPYSPDNVVPVAQLKDVPVQQVIIGSCTNSSYHDLATAAAIVAGKKIHSGVDLVISPGSRRVYRQLVASGALEDLLAAGARILECACGPCIGMGLAPASDSVSLRTFNRNFRGRSGTQTARVYLASPEVAAVSSLYGYITTPQILGEVIVPRRQPVCTNDELITKQKSPATPIVRGPNIKPCPVAKPPAEQWQAEVLLKVGDNITTDDIMPAGAKILPYRSNIPALSQFCFSNIDPDFPLRIRKAGGGFILAKENYGQGSSREHAALAPLYLGVKAIIALSYARIHRANLINNGIIPFLLANSADYEKIALGDKLCFPSLRQELADLTNNTFSCTNATSGKEIGLISDVNCHEREILLAGGLLNHTNARLSMRKRR